MSIINSNFGKKKVEFIEVPLKSLIVDKYQRPLDEKLVNKIATEYDPDIIGVILTSYRNGFYYVLDGHHRVNGARRNSETAMMCQVLRNLTYEEEAAKFKKLNTERKALSSQDKFVAGVEAKDEFDMVIKKVIDECGAQFQRGINNKSFHITCISTCKEAYQKYGEEVLRETLRILIGTWNGYNKSLCAQMIKGMSKFVNTYKDQYDRNVLISRLQMDSPEDLMLEARWDTCRTEIQTLRHGTPLARVIHKRYNSGKGGLKLVASL